MLAPDCGMKYLPRDSAAGKLRVDGRGGASCCAPSSAPDGRRTCAGHHPRAAGRRRRPRPGRRLAAHRRRHADVRRRGRPGRRARASGCATRGCGRGDLVVVTTRTTPPYLLCWLALATLGAVTRADRPGGARRTSWPAWSARSGRGCWSPTPALRPTRGQDATGGRRRRQRCSTSTSCSATGADATGAGAALPSTSAPDDLAVLIPTSGTTGRSKLVMQTHRAYAMAGEGFPYWMELDRRRPADDVAAAVPHQRAGLLGAGLAGLRRRAGAAAAVLGQRLPRLGAPARRDRVQRDRRDARDPDAPAGAARTTPTPPLRLCYTGPSPAQEWQEAFERRFGLRVVVRLRDVGVAVRPDLAARHPAVRHARLGPAAPDARARSTRPGWSTTTATTSAPGETGELLLRNPAVTPGYWEMPEETAAAVVDGWLHTGDLVTVERRTARYTFVVAAQGGAAPARPEPVAGRGRGRDPGAPRRARGARSSAVPSELTEDEVKAFVVAGAGPDARLRRAARLDRRRGCRRSRCRGSGRLSTRCRARRPPGSPSTGCRPGTQPDEYDAARRRERAAMTGYPTSIGTLGRVDHPAARPGPRRRPDGPGRLRRAGVLAGGDAPADAGRAAGLRGRAGRAGRPRPHARRRSRPGSP